MSERREWIGFGVAGGSLAGSEGRGDWCDLFSTQREARNHLSNVSRFQSEQSVGWWRAAHAA